MADDLDYLLGWQPGQSLDNNASGNSQGQYQSFNYGSRLKDAQYLNDLRGFFAERGVTDKTDEELDDMLHNSANYRDLNTVGAFFGAYGSQADLATNSKGDDSLLRASRLHVAMQNAPTIFEEGGRDVSEALPSIAGAIVTDPVNLALGVVEAATLGSATPFVAGGRAAVTGGSALASGVIRGGAQAAKIGAIEGALSGVIQDVGQQNLEQDLGLSDGFSLSRTAESAAINTALSAATGGLFGAIGGGVGGLRGQRVVDGLKAKGYNTEEIAGFLEVEGGLQKMAQVEPEVYRQGLEEEKRLAIEAETPPINPIADAERVAKYQRDVRISSHQTALNDNLAEMRQRLANLRADNTSSVDGVGYLDDQINETLGQIANLEAMKAFPASVARREQIINELLADPDAAKRAKAIEMTRDLTSDRARFEEVMAADVPEDIQKFIDERISNNTAIDQGRRFETEDTGLDEAARRAAFKARQNIVAQDAKQMVAAEGVVAKETGDLAARTDAATAQQPVLTEGVSSADAQTILEEDALKAEAAALEKKEAAKVAAEKPAAVQVTEQVQEALPMPVTPTVASKPEVPIVASKHAKARALELGVDLADVKGTGDKGRILWKDVEAVSTEKGISENYVNSVNELIAVMTEAKKLFSASGIDDAQATQLLSNPEAFEPLLKAYNRDSLKGRYNEDQIASLMDVYRSQLGDGVGYKAPDGPAEEALGGKPGLKIGGSTTAKAVATPAADEKPALTVQAKGELKPRDKLERKEYFRLVEEFTGNGFSEQAAHQAAGYEVYRARTAQAKKDVQSLDPRMQKASPIPVDAEGNPIIKLQSFLKPGRSFTDKAAADGSEYSIQGSAPNVAMFHFDRARTTAMRAYETQEKLAQIELRLGRRLTDDEIMSERSLNKSDLAKLKGGRFDDDNVETLGKVPENWLNTWKEVRDAAKAEGRAFNRTPVMPFVAKGFERVRDAKTKANKGDTLYVSGKSGKIYSDWRNAAKDAGIPNDGLAEPEGLVRATSALRNSLASGKSRTSGVSLRASQVDEALKTGKIIPAAAETMTLNDFVKSLAEIAGVSTTNPTIPVNEAGLPPLTQGNKRAFFINKKTGDIRIPTDAQIAKGDTAKNVLGKSPVDDWTVEYHEKGTPRSKTGLKVARDNYVANFEKKRTATVKPMKVSEASSDAFTASLVPELKTLVDNVNASIQAAAGLPGVDPLFGLMSLRNDFTSKDVMAISDMAHRMPMPSVNKTTLGLLKAIADLEDLTAPNGFRKAEPLRAEAVNSVRSIFAKMPQDIIDPIVDLLSRLSNGTAPRIALADDASLGPMAFDPRTSTVLINKGGLTARDIPASHTFFHEIGHWGHLNLLTARDRAEFWQWAMDNLPNEAAIRSNLGIDPKAGKTADYYAAYFSNPAEFFAESFARWATGRLDTASNPKMWQRFSKYLKGVYDFVVKGKRIGDRDLEKLFLKIMPDELIEESGDNLDALKTGHLTAAESIPDPDVGTTEVQRVPDPSLAARPDYLSLPLDDLIEMGDETRVPFIQKLKQATTSLDNVQDLWNRAEDSLDPSTALEAYSETMRLLIGSTTSLEEKRHLLANVARAKKEAVQPMLSASSEPFSPYQSKSLNIVPRSKKMRRMLSMARTGKVQAMDSNDLVNLGDIPDSVSGTEIIEAGLSTDDHSKVASALLSIYTGTEGQENAGLKRMLGDMRLALNTAYEQSGVIPEGRFEDAAALPRELQTFSVGRFVSVGLGDTFQNPLVKGMIYTAEDVAPGVVTLRDTNGQAIQVKGNELDAYSRKKSDKGVKIDAETMRKQRVAASQELSRQLRRQRIDEARKIANQKLSALATTTMDANPLATSTKALKADDLLRRVTSNTDLADHAADEVVRRERAVAFVPDGIKPSNLEDAREGVTFLREKILSGDASADGDVLAVGGAKISPKSRAVNLAVRSELNDARGVIDPADVGVPPAASPLMTTLLQNIEHRARNIKYTARTLGYRLLKLANPDNEASLTITPDSDEWKRLRTRLKTTAELLAAEGPADNIDAHLMALIYETNPDIKGKLDTLDYSVSDAVEMMRGVLDLADRPIEAGERALASEIFDHMGYLVNGLIANDGAKVQIHRLTYFGDMVATNSATDSSLPGVISLTKAMSLGQLSFEKVGVDPAVLSRQGYNDIALVRGYMYEDGAKLPVNPELVSSPFDGITSFSDLTTAALAETKTKDGKPRKRVSLSGAPASAFGGMENKKAALLTAKKADAIRNEIVKMDDPVKKQAMMEALEAHLDTLSSLGALVPNFSVVALRAKTQFNPSAVIDTPKKVDLLRRSVADALEDGDIPTEAAAKIDKVLAAFGLGQTGQGLLNDLSKVLTGPFTTDDFLRSLGYDSVLDQYGRIARVFDKDQMAPVTDFMDPIFSSPIKEFDDSIDSHVGTNLNMAMMSPLPTLETFNAPPAYLMANKTDSHSAKQWLLNFGRNRVPRKSDFLAPMRMKHKFLGSNSERMRSAGLNTLGDWFENHFPWVQQDFSRRILGTKANPGPLRAIRMLADAPSGTKRWLANSVGKTLQVESHTKILNALWEPSNPRHEAKLNADERSALKVIRDSMNKAFIDLRTTGVMMGSRGKNYFPQIWSQIAIRKDPVGAAEGFYQYLRVEALRENLPIEETTMRKKANDIVATLAQVDDDSAWDPDTHQLAAQGSENIDQPRKIALDQYPEALKFLKPYLEQDLESHIVKYFDQVSHKMSLAKKFGYRNHGFGDYMSVVIDGREGIAQLLTSKRTTRHSTYSVKAGDGLREVQFEASYPMPFEHQPHKAVAAADEVIDIYNTLGPVQARRYLLDLAIPDESNRGNPSVVYERRVDAIVDALRDYKGKPQTISSTDGKFLTNSMKVASRRPLIGDTTSLVKTAKNLRSFNSISLLSYTLLASLGDVGLPLVRSGSMRDTMRAWGKYMNDPDYREGMRNVGAALESLLHNRMTYMNGTPANRLTSAFFNATGLTPWTDEMRTISTAVGLEAFKTAQKKALNAYNPAVPMAQQPTIFRQQYRFLKRYGLEEFATNHKAIESQEFMETDTVRTGLMKFVDDAVFSPNPDDIPLWAQTPWGAVMFQLKSFPLMMGRMAKETFYDDMRLAFHDMAGKPFDVSDIKGTGNPRRALYMATLMPLLGYGATTAMDVVRGRGGEDRNERTPANRTMSQLMSGFPGFEKDYQQSFGMLEQIADRETLDAFTGQYLSAFSTAAGLGLVADMLISGASQADNGAFGTERMMSTVFGPSVGTGISAWHVAQGVLDGNDASSYPERQALRETLRRVPVLGGQNPLIESLIEGGIPKSKARNMAAKKGVQLFE